MGARDRGRETGTWGSWSGERRENQELGSWIWGKAEASGGEADASAPQPPRGSRRLRFRRESVADAAHRLDVARAGGAVAELATQIRHVRLHRAPVGLAHVVPAREGLAAQDEREVGLAAHAALGLEQRREKVELGACEIELLTIALHDALFGVEPDVAVHEPLVVGISWSRGGGAGCRARRRDRSRRGPGSAGRG